MKDKNTTTFPVAVHISHVEKKNKKRLKSDDILSDSYLQMPFIKLTEWRAIKEKYIYTKCD